MSLVALAELLDQLVDARGILISEYDKGLVASQLDAQAGVCLSQAIERLGWTYRLTDGEDNPFTAPELCPEYEPYRLTLTKPAPAQPDTLYLLTAVGLRDALAQGHGARYWRIARLRQTLVTQARAFGNWQEPLTLHQALPTRSPRSLVRETASNRQLPEDIRPWLLEETTPVDFAEPLHALWAGQAFEHLTRSLTNELDANDGALIFRGPPALRLPASGGMHGSAAAFEQLQQAARWVYEWSREAEVRHAMLATEIARSGRDPCAPGDYLAEHLGNALEAAREVYQLHLSDVTVNTLQALSTLRGNVTDDAARTTESTQQALTKVAAALGVGLALIGSGMVNALDPWLITLVMVVTCAYCLLEICAGGRLIQIRASSRDAWQARLYRFLPRAEYDRMVLRPAERSARVYRRTTRTGFGLVLILSAVLVGSSFLRGTSGPQDGLPPNSTRVDKSELSNPHKPKERAIKRDADTTLLKASSRL